MIFLIRKKERPLIFAIIYSRAVSLTCDINKKWKKGQKSQDIFNFFLNKDTYTEIPVFYGSMDRTFN